MSGHIPKNQAYARLQNGSQKNQGIRNRGRVIASTTKKNRTELVKLTEKERVYYTKVVCVLLRKIKASSLHQEEKDELYNQLKEQLSHGKFSQELERKLRKFCADHC